MRVRHGLVGLGLALLLGGSAALPQKVFSQETSTDSAKRKVRSRVIPEYPPLAKKMGLVGKVKIAATISVEGRVTETKVMGGNPVLADSAIDALKKWRFEPGQKESTEIIEFQFNGQ